MPGRPRYTWWDQVPPDVATTAALRRERLRPGGEAVAVIDTQHGRRGGVYPLYARAEALPLRAASEAQREVLRRNRERQASCQRCWVAGKVEPAEVGNGAGRPWRSVYHELTEPLIPERRLCLGCYAAVWEVAERRSVSAYIDRLRRQLEVPWAAIDFETTGLAAPWVVEVGVVVADGRVLFESLVNPLVPIEPEAEAVNGISAEMVRQQPTWVQVLPRLEAALNQAGIRQLVSWGDFERRVIAFEAASRGVPPLSRMVVDARAMWQAGSIREVLFAGDRPKHDRVSLASACAAAGVRPGSHRAADDARAAAEVLQVLLRSVPEERYASTVGAAVGAPA